jgi:hypothetical protein
LEARIPREKPPRQGRGGPLLKTARLLNKTTSGTNHSLKEENGRNPGISPGRRLDMELNVASDPKDVELEALLNRKFRSKGNNVRVIVDEGHVSLFGSVDDFNTKRLITSEAQGIAGTRKLNSYIRVTR